MATTSDNASLAYRMTIPLINGTSTTLPLSTVAPLFIVGPNGAGKSGLILKLFQSNFQNALRVAAHRQTWLESNSVPFSPQQKIQNEKSTKTQDNLAKARWSEYQPSLRSGFVISDLIDADNALSRKVTKLLSTGDTANAQSLAVSQPPLAVISDLFNSSGIPIKLTIGDNSAIFASKSGGALYSIASLSDGERAALLIAGAVLTAPKGTLILIDEPERHLHASIVTPLLLQLFSKRSDCAFVISTHELGLPVNCPSARTVLVRGSTANNDRITNWDLDILESGIEIDDTTKEAIIGSRRKMLFVEGTPNSLDKPLYEILFPEVAIFPRSSCNDVIHAVSSVRDTSELAWVNAYGIVDQDQIAANKRSELEAKGVFPISVYSVEALYYNPNIVKALAAKQETVIDADAAEMIPLAWDNVIDAVSSEVDRLAARMTEQAVKDKISLQTPSWKTIATSEEVSITVDTKALYKAERDQLQNWLDEKEADKIIERYPVRETRALEGIVNALQFKSKDQYQAAARKLITEDPELKAMLLEFFGKLPDELGNQSNASTSTELSSATPQPTKKPR